MENKINIKLDLDGDNYCKLVSIENIFNIFLNVEKFQI